MSGCQSVVNWLNGISLGIIAFFCFALVCYVLDLIIAWWRKPKGIK